MKIANANKGEKSLDEINEIVDKKEREEDKQVKNLASITNNQLN